MEIAKLLDKIEDKFEGEDFEEHREDIVAELTNLHHESGEDEDNFNRFLVQVATRFGGVYIPYLFWDKLSEFMENPDQRIYLYQLVKSFSESDFYELEQKRMKSLLITYIAKEKQFEIDKLRALILDKAHPTVKEYFMKLSTFVEKNQKSTSMYCEKFDLLKDIHPNFDLMDLPVTQIKEKFQRA